jgi:hypothetical protein
MDAKPRTELALRTPAAIEPWLGATWQRLWLALQGRPWTALALLPASSGAPANFTLEIATTLARTGMIHLNCPIHVADGGNVQLNNVAVFAEEVRRCRDVGDRVFLALDPLSQNPVAETLAQAADCVLLCVLFERMAASETARTVSKVGKERFIGSTIFLPDASAPM